MNSRIRNFAKETINSTPPLQEKKSTFITNTTWLMSFKEIFAVHSDNHTEALIMLCGRNAEFLNIKAGRITQQVPTAIGLPVPQNTAIWHQ
jgi:hypothetical protein